MAVLLENPVRSYAWGSPTVIPALLGIEPTGEPQAELWVGAHPGSPSVVAGDGRTLGQYIADDPEDTLGMAVVKRFGATLPYLLKILAIERPLSIQAHPTIEQAEQGYDAEEAAGVPLGSPKRSYRDRNHKPEMVVALTEFEALLGFRDQRELVHLFEETAPEMFAGPIDKLKRDGGLPDLVSAWLRLADDEVARTVAAVTDVARRYPDRAAFRVVADLADTYPGDRGLLLALLMQRVSLRPGEAAFVDAGVPHAYLSGVAVEPQASSDNTLRAGLTPKHVDTAEVERLLRYEPTTRVPGGGNLIRSPQQSGPGEHVYSVLDLDEFRLCRLDLNDEEIQPTGAGPRVVLVVEGSARIRTGTGDAARDAGPAGGLGETLHLRQGRAAFVPAAEWPVTVTGEGTAFTITPNLSPVSK